MKLPLIMRRLNGAYVGVNVPFDKFQGDINEKLSAFAFHEGTVWWDSRLRSENGTIEVRPACCQPHKDSFTLSALCLGLIENLEESNAFSENLSLEKWREIKEDSLVGIHKRELLKEMLLISEKGLKKRGLGEEFFLEPLWERFEKRENPAEKSLKIFRESGMSGLTKSFL